MSTRRSSWCLAQLLAATAFACGACETAVSPLDPAASSNPDATFTPEPVADDEDDAGGFRDAGRDATADARSRADANADAGAVAVDASVPALRPLDLSAKETDHGLPTPATTTLKSIVFTGANQQRQLTYVLESSNPLVPISPTTSGAAYADDCTLTGSSSPTEYGLVTNASATALYVFLTA